MRWLLTLFIALMLSPAATAAEKPLTPFPDDYIPSPCAQAGRCETFLHSEMQNAAFTFLGLHLDAKWNDSHGQELIKLLEPACRKQSTCLATAGNNNLFCDDVAAPEFWRVCDAAFPLAANPHDHAQCQAFVETFALGVDQRSRSAWLAAQECLTAKGSTPPKSKPPVVWIQPSTLTPDYNGYITIYALDPDTHVPVQSMVRIEGQIIYSPTNPAGDLQAYYPFRWPIQYLRVTGQGAHSTLVPPRVTVSSERYPTVTFPLPVSVPSLTVKLVPPVERLRRGKNIVTVVAADSVSGKPVELRVMYGNRTVGTSNEPIELEIDRKAKRSEIWVTSLFNRYSDATVIPAEK